MASLASRSDREGTFRRQARTSYLILLIYLGSIETAIADTPRVAYLAIHSPKQGSFAHFEHVASNRMDPGDDGAWRLALTPSLSANRHKASLCLLQRQSGLPPSPDCLLGQFGPVALTCGFIHSLNKQRGAGLPPQPPGGTLAAVLCERFRERNTKRATCHECSLRCNTQ